VRALVLGGARSGKSAFAESLLAGEPAVDYLATAVPDPDDPEWTARIARHRERRPAHWRTRESTDLAAALAEAGAAAVLVDSVTGWLAGTMDAVGMWHGAASAAADLGRCVDDLVEAWRASVRRVVAVSDEVGLGVVPDSASGRTFRDALGLLNQALAASAEEVYLVTAGLPLRLK
jgi:adenosylcobinamide kinase/adenosylcobinamide-phosphate guanylyltransferase